MVEPHLTPEQRSRVTIDKLLTDAGWTVQNPDEMNIGAGRGVAVREFPTATGPVDYLLYGDRKAIGTVEAKKEGTTLLGVEPQADRYAEGFLGRPDRKACRHGALPLPFHYMSTGKETYFTSRLDPRLRAARGLRFSPTRDADRDGKVGRDAASRNCGQMPALNSEGLWANQVAAIEGLEESFAP